MNDVTLGSDAKLTIGPGVVVGFEDTGLTVDDQAEVEINGHAERRVAFVSALGTQENIPGIDSPESPLVIVSDEAIVTAEFADFSVGDPTAMSFGAATSETWGDLGLYHCEFRGGEFSIVGNTGTTVTTIELFSNLFEGVPLTLETPYSSVELRGNGFIDSDLSLDYGVDSPPGGTLPSDWTIVENLLYNSPLSIVHPTGANVSAQRNGYVGTSSSLRFDTGELNSIDLTGNHWFSYGPFGPYYIPTSGSFGNFGVDLGSQSADSLGLYHFTTQNNLVETNSVVNIGIHFPATSSSGSLLDTDGDGIGNILEDIDGDGVVDSSELDWTTSENGTTGVPGLQVFTRLD